MALNKEYPADFTRLWNAWPKWPAGRSKKHLAWRKFEEVKREEKLSPEDLDEMLAVVERMKRDRLSWQPGNRFGPQGLQVWLHQRGWLDEYEKVRPHWTQVRREQELPQDPARRADPADVRRMLKETGLLH